MVVLTTLPLGHPWGLYAVSAALLICVVVAIFSDY
jgi:hypothetical protein